MNKWTSDIKSLWEQLPENTVTDSTVMFAKNVTEFISKKEKTFQLLHLPGLNAVTVYAAKEAAGDIEYLKDAYFCVIKGLLAVGKHKSINILNQYADTKRLTILDDDYKEKWKDGEIYNDAMITKLGLNNDVINDCCKELLEDLPVDKVNWKLKADYDTTNNRFKYVVFKTTRDSSDYSFYKKEIYKPMKKAIFNILDTVLDLGYNPLNVLSYYLDKFLVKEVLNSDGVKPIDAFRIDMFDNDISSLKIKDSDAFKEWLDEKAHC